MLMGGVDTVRGYGLGEVGPPNQGTIMNVYNVEYKFPIVQESGRTFTSHINELPPQAVLAAKFGVHARRVDNIVSMR